MYSWFISDSYLKPILILMQWDSWNEVYKNLDFGQLKYVSTFVGMPKYPAGSHSFHHFEHDIQIQNYHVQFLGNFVSHWTVHSFYLTVLSISNGMQMIGFCVLLEGNLFNFLASSDKWYSVLLCLFRSSHDSQIRPTGHRSEYRAYHHFWSSRATKNIMLHYSTSVEHDHRVSQPEKNIFLFLQERIYSSKC